LGVGTSCCGEDLLGVYCVCVGAERPSSIYVRVAVRRGLQVQHSAV
jgi:hypothetical protein